MKILILGHTGHIGRGLFEELGKEHEVNGSSRSEPWDDWIFQRYDIIINCVGTGTPKNTAEAGNGIIETTFLVDQAVLSYMNTAKGKDTMYVYLSSGVADERFFDMSPYAVSKVATEMVHRAHVDKWIIDLRIYSYLSEYIDLESGFLITEMIKCVLEKETFYCENKDIVRNYMGAHALANSILSGYDEGKHNRCGSPHYYGDISMIELLNIFEYRYDLDIMFNINPAQNKRINYSPLTGKEILYLPQKLIIPICDKIIARERGK
jgi:dTDP-4-dehydrorhamnose reductase